MLYALAALVAVLVAVGLWLYVTGSRSEPRKASAAASSEGDDADFSDYAESAGTVVLLRDNFWDEHTFDGRKEDWRRFTAQGVRGFAGVPGGRHQAVTTCAKGAARMDFVIYPGEIMVRRLDHATARWGEEDPESRERYEALARGGARGAMATALVGYKTALGVARAMSGEKLAAPDEVVRGVMRRLTGVIERALAGEAPDTLLREADEIGRDLVGVPLTRGQLRALTAAIGEIVSVQGMARAWKRGALVASIGLALLPGDPHLEEQLASVLCDSGLAEDALEHIDDALARASVFDEDGLARAHATRAEILAALGRTAEARSIIDALVARRPRDTNAARVRAVVYEKVAN